MARQRRDLQDLLDRVDLAALLDELAGEGTGIGPWKKWRCIAPDHADRHPSVTMTVDRRGVPRWRCWSGGHGGTAIDAIVTARGVSVADAINELCARAGMPSMAPLPRARRTAPPPVRLPVPLSAEAMSYVEACEQMLWEPAGERVLEYLIDERALDAEVLRTNRVGADPGTRTLRRAGGLPKYGPGAVFPARDADGRLVYFQTRYLEPGLNRSKYDNPASRHGANPRLAWTRPAIEAKQQPVVICEGFPDAYIANCAGYDAVAVLGTANATPALAEQLAPQLRGRPTILALDGDEAGRTATNHLRAGLERCGIMVVELPLPSGIDLNSWVREARQLPDVGRAVRPIQPPGLAGAPSPALPGS